MAVICIRFGKHVVNAEYETSLDDFDNKTKHKVGVGIYTPIGDGYSYSALWCSNKLPGGTLGSGIAIKNKKGKDFEGNYDVLYFVEQVTNDRPFNVEIVKEKDGYKLTWFQNGKKLCHGMGYKVNESLCFAWGDNDAKFSCKIEDFLNDNI